MIVTLVNESCEDKGVFGSGLRRAEMVKVLVLGAEMRDEVSNARSLVRP